MRAFYSTQKQFRVFILGTPEGWHVFIYNLQMHEWVENNGWRADTLKQAKATAQDKTASLLGRNTPEMKWR